MKRKFDKILDLDIDSQGDGANAIMSGLESESESECEPEEEFAETQYIHCPEDEFGAVSLIVFRSTFKAKSKSEIFSLL